MNLTLNLEEEVFILNNYDITPTQLMFIRLLLILQEEGKEELFCKYIRSLKSSGVNVRDLIISLQEKGIILKSYKPVNSGNPFNPLDIPINKNFTKNLYKYSFELGKELFEVYPQFGSINNSIIPLRTVAKHFDSLEDCYFKYGKAIKWNLEKHKYIIDLVKWSKEHDLINMSLSSFVINNSWLDLEAMKNGDTLNYNPDTIREL